MDEPSPVDSQDSEVVKLRRDVAAWIGDTPSIRTEGGTSDRLGVLERLD